MQRAEPFKIDRWSHQERKFASMQLAPDASHATLDPNLKLTYGTLQGSLRLRERLAKMHSSPKAPLTADNVVITPGAIMANYLVLAAICGPDNHIVCQYPTYGQLYLLPRYNGVDVSLWAMDENDNWSSDVAELASMIKPNTKAIIINNPNNPTGAVISKDKLEEILALARERDIVVFSDEVYSPLFHTSSRPPPLVSLGYSHSISTGSVSKAHGLPGLRVGWVVSQNAEILQRITTLRDYTTTSVSQLDDSVAAFALSEEVLPQLLERNLKTCAESIVILDEFIKRNARRCRWAKPDGAATAFVQILNEDGSAADDVAFSKQLAEQEGIVVLPGGHCFGDAGVNGLKGYIRLPLGQPMLLDAALETLEKFIHNQTHF
ncbi:aspartate aminotransferase [Fusarium pseudoanthophilum]|uniref:Aspartate aminotransferase n=1 Tax=Fusarium pseudoanthophilum TaxID=48495 RepID=A0A8H5PN26_9HYPO|nr:aspartate aminotransferase [Fusarium pseudoanthophilum]